MISVIRQFTTQRMCADFSFLEGFKELVPLLVLVKNRHHTNRFYLMHAVILGLLRFLLGGGGKRGCEARFWIGASIIMNGVYYTTLSIGSI